MGAPDYAAVLDVIASASPGELVGLLQVAAEPLGANDVNLYLVDFQGTVLQPVLLSPGLDEEIVPEEDVANSMAGRAFQTGQVMVADRGGSVRLWVPLVERGERTGVMALTLPSADEDTVTECVRLGLFAGLLVRGFARTTDLLHLRRRRQSMSLAAGMQWDLLPPLAVRSTQALACGRLEPAYDVAGDAFDYAFNYRYLDAAVFDGMGHGVEATMMTTLAMGAYRHSRRVGEGPAEAYAAVDRAISEQYQGEAFVTGAFLRLSLERGELEWVNAGHPQPLLLRGQRVARELHCAPSLPLGLGGECRQVGSDTLEPGDSLLLVSDGVHEARSSGGEEFGVERLARLWEQQWASGLPPEEVLRRVVESIIEFGAGKLRDDATLMQLSWYGPAGDPGSQVEALQADPSGDEPPATS